MTAAQVSVPIAITGRPASLASGLAWLGATRPITSVGGTASGTMLGDTPSAGSKCDGGAQAGG